MESTLEQSNTNVIRIAIVGPESTGKTTLAKALAAHYNVAWVPEYMREYFTNIAPREPFESYYSDLTPIAQGQMVLENKAANGQNKLIICDTNLLELSCYASYYFNACPPEILKASNKHTYDLTLLTYIDVPWQKDELRDRPNDRKKLFTIFEQTLAAHNSPHCLLKGNQNTRLAQAILLIDKLLP